MNLEESLNVRREITWKRWQLRNRKLQVYANEENIHKNFYQVSEIVKTLNIKPDNPLKWCLCLIIHKIQRITNFLKNPNQETIESFEDTVMDLLNYVEILYELYVDHQVENEELEDGAT